MKLKPVSTSDEREQLLAVTRDGGLHIGSYRNGKFMIQGGSASLRAEDIKAVYAVEEDK